MRVSKRTAGQRRAVGAGGERLRAIGAQLREWRKQEGMTLQDVAAKVGMDIGDVSRCERGQLGVPRRRVGLFAAVLGERVWELFGGKQLDLAEAVRVSAEQEAALRATLQHAAQVQHVLRDLLAPDFEALALPDGSLLLRATSSTIAAQIAAAGAGGPP